MVGAPTTPVSAAIPLGKCSGCGHEASIDTFRTEYDTKHAANAAMPLFRLVTYDYYLCGNEDSQGMCRTGCGCGPRTIFHGSGRTLDEILAIVDRVATQDVKHSLVLEKYNYNAHTYGLVKPGGTAYASVAETSPDGLAFATHIKLPTPALRIGEELRARDYTCVRETARGTIVQLAYEYTLGVTLGARTGTFETVLYAGPSTSYKFEYASGGKLFNNIDHVAAEITRLLRAIAAAHHLTSSQPTLGVLGGSAP